MKRVIFLLPILCFCWSATARSQQETSATASGGEATMQHRAMTMADHEEHKGHKAHEGHEMGQVSTGDRLRVAVLLYEHAVLVDWAIPAHVFAASGHGQDFEVYTVSETGEPISSELPSSVGIDYALADAPPPDVIVVPGGNWMVLTDRGAVHDWLRRAAENGSIVFSVCTGAYVLAQAGLLDGREATSLHAQLDLLKQLAPAALVRGDLPFVVSGEVITAAGAGTAFEASLYIVEQLAGEASADYLASDYLDYVRYEGR